jgi:predicted dehydrogenase
LNKAKESLGVAMIGQGFMGRAHSNAFLQVNRFFDTPYELKMKVICGRDQANLNDMADRWGWDETETQWQAILDRKDVQVIDIAAPNHLHAEIAIAAAKAGKIVLCEKPLARNYAEARRMAESASQVPNLVWFNYRRVPAIALAKRIVDDGRLGEIYHYRATYLQSWGASRSVNGWRFNRAEAGSGAVGDLLGHLIDLALLLNGRIAELSAVTHTFAPGREVDDAVLVQARFENGSIGTFEATRYAIGCQNRNTFEIHGAKGMIRFNLEDLNHLDFFDAQGSPQLQGTSDILVTDPDHPYTRHFWPPGHIIGYEHTFIATMADFLSALSLGQPFHANFQDALEVQRILDAAEESSKRRAWQTLMPDPVLSGSPSND